MYGDVEFDVKHMFTRIINITVSTDPHCNTLETENGAKSSGSRYDKLVFSLKSL